MTPDDLPADLLTGARAALDGLALPAGGTLGPSGRLAGPVVAGGRLTATIAVAADEATAYEPLRAMAEAALRALPGGAGALVVLTADRGAGRGGQPASGIPRAAAQGSAGQAAQTAAPQPMAGQGAGDSAAAVLPGVAHVIAVASGKGGVGKSTTCVNLALGLRALGLRVGILDADIHGPSLPTLLGLHGRPRVGPGRKLIPMQAHGLKAMSMGLLVDAETAMIWRGPMVMSAITQLVADVDWGVLDVLLIDMPPGTGDAQLAVAQGTALAGAVIVSTPQDLALIDARRGIQMFRKVNVPILGVVENMAHFVCPDCGGRHEIFGAGGARAEAQRLGVPYLGAVPLTMDLRAASDAGRPVVAQAPEGTLGRLYTTMAATLWSGLATAAHPRSA